MPGVLIVEALVQAAGILIYNSLDDPRNKLVFLSKIDKTKFRRPVIPGDQLRLDVDLVKLKTRFFQVAGRAFVEDALVAETEAMGSLVALGEMNERG
jgi:3-hydroxyacyl-[acyl-carrier-protein] dehydratase/UDP-3-O-[3-hydroxymyristoyl] N-acetylglucosamine deacetylase/3-hydroxyacyl-[acyl-carrier-protein] dehydratase